jgi:pilus assembly protein Flp/PilA
LQEIYAYERARAFGCPTGCQRARRTWTGEAQAVRDRITQWAHIAKQAQEQGQGLIEYALLLVFIAVVAVASVTALGATVTSLFSRSVFSF